MNSAPFPIKSAPCRFFVKDGSCIYGELCQFSHDIPQKMIGSAIPPGVNVLANDSSGMYTGSHLNQGAVHFMPKHVPSNYMEGYGEDGNALATGDAGELVDQFSGLALGIPPVPSHTGFKDTGGGQFDILQSKVGQHSPSGGMTPGHSVASPLNPYNPYMKGIGGPISDDASPGHSPAVSPMPNGHSKLDNNSMSPSRHIIESVGGTTYFYSPEVNSNPLSGSANVMLPNFSLYPGPLPHVAHLKCKAGPAYAIADDLKLDVLNRQCLTMAQIDPEQYPDIPTEVDSYHSLFPLESRQSPSPPASNTLGLPSSVFKAINSRDGLTYCLRRVHGFRLPNMNCTSAIEVWKKMSHPNIVRLREVFTTKAFGDNSIVFVFDYFPGSETMYQRYFSRPQHHQLNGYNNPYNIDGQARPYSAGKGRVLQGLINESQIWWYIIQLTSIMRIIHQAGLACRIVDPAKILLTDKNRLRLNCCSIVDVLTYDASHSQIQQHQQEDLMSLGQVLLALACNSVLGIRREYLQTSIDLVSRHYSGDLKNVIQYLLSSQARSKNVNEIMPMIGARFYQNLDATLDRHDLIENELSKEVENSRLFRLLCKLGTINERPEFNMDTAWSETGDRYMLKLFRDYLFHQVDEAGAPWIDMAHIVQCLNKLDAGSPEKVVLMSRDEQNVLVVTYADLKHYLDTAFFELQGGQQH